MKPLVVGNSHTGCIWRTIDTLKVKPFRSTTMFSGLLEEQPFSAVEEGRVAPTVDLTRERLEGLIDEAHFSADYHWAFVLGTHFIPFLRHDFWSGCSIEGVGEGRPVSRAAVGAAAVGYTAPVLRFFRQLKACDVSFSVVSAPPPRRDRWEKSPLGVERALTIFTAAKTAFMADVAEMGAPIVEPPPEAVNEQGLLKEEYWSRAPKDFPHGNMKYGALMVARLRDHFDELGLATP